MTKAKPCPFCGKEGTATVTTAQNCEECGNFEDSDKCPAYEPYVEPVFDNRGCLYRTVICNFNKGGCGATCGWYPSIEKAIEAWNRRAGKQE